MVSLSHNAHCLFKLQDHLLTSAASHQQASESRLYTFSDETKQHLRKFRLTTSRAKGPQAVICMYVSLPIHSSPLRQLQLNTTLRSDMIDKHTHEIRQDEDQTVYTSLEEVGDDLPDHAPRFVLLSYPITMVRFDDQYWPLEGLEQLTDGHSRTDACQCRMC